MLLKLIPNIPLILIPNDGKSKDCICSVLGKTEKNGLMEAFSFLVEDLEIK